MFFCISKGILILPENIYVLISLQVCDFQYKYDIFIILFDLACFIIPKYTCNMIRNFLNIEKCIMKVEWTCF